MAETWIVSGLLDDENDGTGGRISIALEGDRFEQSVQMMK